MLLTAGARVIARIWRHDEGQDLVEYALLVALIAIVAVAAVSSLGIAVRDELWGLISASMP